MGVLYNMERFSAGYYELCRMFSINPNPKVEISVRIKRDLTDDEEEMIKFLKKGELPNSITALSHVDKLLATDDSLKQTSD